MQNRSVIFLSVMPYVKRGYSQAVYLDTVVLLPRSALRSGSPDVASTTNRIEAIANNAKHIQNMFTSRPTEINKTIKQ